MLAVPRFANAARNAEGAIVTSMTKIEQSGKLVLLVFLMGSGEEGGLLWVVKGDCSKRIDTLQVFFLCR